METSKKNKIINKDKNEDSCQVSKISYSKPTLTKWGKVIDTKATSGSTTSGAS